MLRDAAHYTFLLQTMSDDQLQAFLEAVKADAGLQEKLKGATELDIAVAIAKEAGFDLRKDDFDTAKQTGPVELSDEELDAVTGGSLADLVIRGLFRG